MSPKISALKIKNSIVNSITDFYSIKDENAITCVDLDNDSKMELLIEVPWYEFGLDVYVYRYEDGKIKGRTDAINWILP